MKLDWRAYLGIGITAFLLWFVFRDLSWTEVWFEVQRANLWLLTGAVGIVTGTFFLRALRWKILLHPVCPDTTLHSRFAAVNIGFMVNNLLPVRVGEFARALALARMEPVSTSAAFGSLVVERFLDAMAIFLLMLVAIAAPGFPPEPIVWGVSLGVWIRLATMILGLVLSLMVLILIFPKALVRVVGAFAKFLPGKLQDLVVEVMESFLDGFKVFRNPRLLIMAVLWSLGIWAWHSLGFWMAFRAFGIELGYDAALFVNATVALVVGVPAAPGFFGTFHTGAFGGLAVYGIPEAKAGAFAAGFHLGGFIPVTLIGLFFAWRLGLTFKDMEAGGTQVAETVGECHPGPSGPGTADTGPPEFGP